MGGDLTLFTGKFKAAKVGKLGAGGSPANGSYQLQCRLFNAVTGGDQKGSTQEVLPQS
jgi:hypothetical protein